MNSGHFGALRSIIAESELSGVAVQAKDVSGLSGDRLVGLLQRLARYQEEIDGGCYVEVGVFQGLTLVSAGSALTRELAFGIDNFTQFDPDGRNRGIIETRVNANKLRNVSLIALDFEDALENLDIHIAGRRVGVFFVDGPHDYRSQLICLNLIEKHLSKSGIIVVDDCNYEHVRLANRDFLVSRPQFKLIFEAYTHCHPHNMSPAQRASAQRGWWNGVNVIARDSEGVLLRTYPTTSRDRAMYFNEHIIHAARYGVLAPEALALADSLLSHRPIKAARQIMRFLRRPKSLLVRPRAPFATANTFSEALPPSRLNPSLPETGMVNAKTNISE